MIPKKFFERWGNKKGLLLLTPHPQISHAETENIVKEKNKGSKKYFIVTAAKISD